ncbi:MAG: RNA polymerase sigma factor [Patescibacteria group bacterium]|nr:RNA polymerase sigma factor [Patescibacteria group bacterium]
MRDLQVEFGDAFERWSDELFRHALMRLSDRDKALEVTQECFLRTMQYARSGKVIEQLRPFLYRTLRHLIIDEYRRTKAVSLEAMTESEDGPTLDTVLPPDESNTLESAMERFDAARAAGLLTTLPEPYREALTLRYIDGMSVPEVAAIVGVSENVVSVRVHRGLKKLKDLLEHE